MAHIEDVYELSPLQQGLLFHSVYAPESGVYNVQLSAALHGPLDLAAFTRAWQHELDRHPILRTSFYWEGLDKPAQVVHRRVDLPLRSYDWRALARPEQDARLEEHLRADRVRDFTLSQAPLLRLTLIRLAEDIHHFIWTFHHILLDGWSVPIILQEVFSAYEAFQRGLDAHLERRRPYGDYIEWLQQRIPAQAEAFWRSQLAGVTAPTRLSLDATTEHGAAAATSGELQIQLPAATTAALQSFARQHNLTLNTLVQGAWALLLGHYSGADSLVYGLTVAGRPPDLAGSQAMVGLFINTLPVHISVGPGLPLLAWLRELQEQLAELRQYEHSSLVQIQGWSEVPRDLPLFESIVVFENYSMDRSLSGWIGSLAIRSIRWVERNNYPITVLAVPGASLTLRLLYDTTRFASDTAARMLRHLRALLEGMPGRGARRVGDLAPLSGAERQQLLVEWNDTATAYAHGRCLHELFEAQAQRTLDALAVVFEDQQLTYRELNHRADQLARHLRSLGVGPEAPVGICVERSLDLLIGLLGILKAGGAYLPLDPTYPAERLAVMLEGAQARVLLTDDERRTTKDKGSDSSFIVRRSSLVNLQVVDLRADWPSIARQPATPPRSGVRAESVAYIIYTSGSTGAPKGVMNSHRAIANRLLWMQDTYGLGASDRVLHKTPISFDVSVWELVWPLITGAKLIVARPGGQADSRYLAELIATQQITTLHFVPAMLRLWLEEPGIARCGCLRRVICSGEALPAEVQERFFARLGAELHNLYGPTEAAIDVTAWACRPAGASRGVPIGRPIANTQIYVLTPQLRPVLIGVVGELHIGGVGLARGYLGRPDLTAERFVPNPFARGQGSGVRDQEQEAEGRRTNEERRTTNEAAEHSSFVLHPSSRLYRTGDLARYRADGAIEFLGRSDQQIKLRGFRIELGEIEAVLERHAAVREAAVVVTQPEDSREQRLVAYVVPAEGIGVPAFLTDDERRATNDEGADSSFVIRPSSPASELRDFLKARLPDYMIPAAFVLLDALPLTANGKLDRRALSQLDQVRAEREQPLVLPRTPIEQALAQVWAEVLGVAQVGVYDNFFALGGHSLLGTQMLSRLRDAFQVDLPLRRVFEAPTVADLAREISTAQQVHAAQLPALQPSPRDNPPPLSFAQQRLWFLDQLEPQRATYTMLTAVRLSGPLDVAALHRCLNSVVARHEALRTTFALVGGQPAQIIAPALALPLPLIDLRALAVEQTLVTQRLADGEARWSFDLARGPLLRTTLIRLDAHEHVLLLTMHHIISDGWSVGVLISELATGYASGTGRLDALPALPIQYADYAIWQRAWLQGAALEQQLAYWRAELAGLTPLALPTDRPRSANLSLEGARHMLALPSPLRAQLRALSRAAGVTLFMTLLAGFYALLARYSGQHEIAVGTDVAGRTHTATEGLIGFFVNQLVLHTNLSGNPRFRDWLGQVRARTLDAYAHQHLPFEQLVAELNPARDLATTPLFQVKFVFQNAPLPALEVPGLRFRPLHLQRQIARFDLVLILAEHAEGLSGVIEYRTELFDAATIARLARHFQALLRGIVADPSGRVAELPLLARAERQQLLIEWNDTESEVRSQESGVICRGEACLALTWCIHDLFAAQAARTPDAVALVFDDATNDERRTANGEWSRGEAGLAPTQHLTYGELNRRANQLAHQLQGMGVGPETIVGLCLERGLDLVVGFLGVLKAGGAYLPLDPAYPAERLAFMLADSQAPILLTHTRLLDTLPTSWAYSLCLDDHGAIAHQPAHNPRSPVTPDNPAYVIYTSGSTGVPKGVLVPHRGLSNIATAQIEAWGVRGASRVLQFAALSFDASLSEIGMALLAGAALYLAPPDALQPGAALAQLLRRQAISHATLPPAALSVMPATALPALRTLIAAGEACPPETIARWADDRCFVNAYGPTEATICASFARCRPDGRPPAIGRPCANVQIYLLDAQMRPVPLGAAGELCIGGVGLARGYLGRPDLTAARFIPNPFGKGSGVRSQASDRKNPDPDPRPLIPDPRLYRTGDLARFRPDGALQFLGRADDQIKIRGFRIEPDEIEAALRAHPAIDDCAVVAREDASPASGHPDRRLVAYIIQGSRVGGQGSGVSSLSTSDEGRRTNDESAPSSFVLRLSSLTGELRDFLKQTLPAYMVPAAFVALDALPLTPNGKLDRRALPAPHTARPRPDDTYAAPRAPLETLLAQMWAEILGLDQVGSDENFFDLGGHSLLATQLIARVRAVFGVELPLRRIFEAPTVAAQAGWIARAQRDGAGLSLPPLKPAARDGLLPLSFAQQRLWFSSQLQPGMQIYHVPVAVRVRGPLAVRVLAASLDRIVSRHEVLRTAFVTSGRQPAQVIRRPWRVPLSLLDLQALPAAERAAAVRKLADAEGQRPFDLSEGRLLRVAVLRLAEQEHVVLLTMHHIVSDGWSAGVLVREIAAYYTAATGGPPAELPELPIQYADYALWQREWLQGDVLETQLTYWLAQLAGAPAALNLPADHPRPPIQTLRGSSQARRLDAELTAALRRRCREAEVTLFMLIVASFQVLLAHISGQDDIVVGIDSANRTQVETEHLIGFFINQLAVRTRLAGNPTFREVLARVRTVVLGAYAHQELPFEKLVERLQPERNPSYTPVFQVKLVFQNVPAPGATLPGLALELLPLDDQAVEFDLILSVSETAQGLAATLKYNTDLFAPTTITRWLNQWETLLATIATRPEVTLAELDEILRAADEERQRMEDEALERASRLMLKSIKPSTISIPKRPER